MARGEFAPQLGQESKPERKYSNKYVEYLYAWDTSRRLKKSISGPPENYQHPAAIHGQRVVRLGKGIRPKDDHEEEVLKFGHRKRMIPNRSHQCHPDLLPPSRPSTAPAAAGSVKMFLDENHQRALQVYHSERNNNSSMHGAGVMVTAEAAPHKPHRGRGSANPGWGLSDEMVQTLAFNPEGTKTLPMQRPNKLVWTVAQVPRIPIADLLRHRVSDPAFEASEAKFEVQRPLTPVLQSCSAEERKTAFYSSLQDYAKNKVLGDYGSLRNNSGLRTLAGFAR